MVYCLVDQQGMMLDPNKFSVKFFILYHCYILNSSAAREAFRAMTPREMHIIIRE
jgi:hypothetical protein